MQQGDAPAHWPPDGTHMFCGWQLVIPVASPWQVKPAQHTVVAEHWIPCGAHVGGWQVTKPVASP